MGLFPVTREPVTSLPLHSEIGRKSGSFIELFALARPIKRPILWLMYAFRTHRPITVTEYNFDV